ncbi:MAG TPA: SgcJ/EcaC family oxidoreductase [Miltoncostaeaceae bacterium]|nr:SgcJ/EcaC family oxidoreductase [Miltoncostaeaceae bacterium]
MSEVDQSVVALLDAYRAAVLAKDVEAFLALYDEDVRVFDTWGRWSYDGRGAWGQAAQEWLGGLGDERVAVEVEDVRAIAAEDVAIVHLLVAYAAISPAGDELRRMTNRLTWGLRRAGGSWRIVHEHTSAPVDPATGTAILGR